MIYSWESIIISAMKRALSNILIILVILPGLACGAAACVDAPVVAEAVPCHEQAPDVEKNEKIAPKIFKDCTGIEFAQSAGVDFFKTLQPELVKFVPVPWEDFIVKLQYLAETQQSRAPPDDSPAHQTYPPPYLTTQRLRI